MMDVAALAEGQQLELLWNEASGGGDGKWYAAEVLKLRDDGSVDFTYLSNNEWDEWVEVVPKAELGPGRLRPLQRRRSSRPRKELKFSYRDL
jgi:hypothetical protein